MAEKLKKVQRVIEYFGPADWVDGVLKRSWATSVGINFPDGSYVKEITRSELPIGIHEFEPKSEEKENQE